MQYYAHMRIVSIKHVKERRSCAKNNHTPGNHTQTTEDFRCYYGLSPTPDYTDEQTLQK